MDTLNYHDVVERILTAYTQIPYSYGDLTCEAIFDRPRGRYLLMTVGWDNEKRVHFPVIHIDIVDDKVWLQTDNTNCIVADELVAAGVPKSDIVLGFHPPEVREFTGFAVV